MATFVDGKVRRVLLATLAALSVGMAGVASAAGGHSARAGSKAVAGHQLTKKKKKVCNLVTDPSGDASDPSLDITSADVATKGAWLTVEIRVAKFSSSDSQARFGRQWRITFNASGATKTGSETLENGPFGTYPGAGDARYRYVGNTIRISEKIADFQRNAGITLVPGKTKLYNFTVATETGEQNPNIPAGNLSTGTVQTNAQGADLAPNRQIGTTNASYLVGAPSCVKVGP
jgi:hypothetical protein